MGGNASDFLHLHHRYLQRFLQLCLHLWL